ncbi:MAG: sodium-dependent bicarbonate transport family permease [Xanthomonadaceae bacterium]|jgi:hypothetical protein|nr:sodium-dependent bicarbonate transport family permease [Xanthomonadaceae bacterium]
MQFSPELLTANLLSPVVLAFVLGMVARLIRSDLEVPPQIQQYLAIFLLLAIGLKGGVALRAQPLGELALLVAVTLVAGVVTAFTAYSVARAWLRDDRLNAGAMAAHYGSVSAVTFIAAQQFTERTGAPAEGVLVALVVALEIPAILLGLALAKGGGGIDRKALGEVLAGRTAVLLLGGLAIGAIAGQKGIRAVDDMYFQLFQGTLMLFMLDMGMVAAAQLRQLRDGALRLVAFGTVVPLVHGIAGTFAGHLVGLSPSGATVFGTMVASASYIAAPASVRSALPEADAGRCVTAALGITFPFNLALGIPAYAAFAAWLAP